MQLKKTNISRFKNIVWNYYHQNKRDLPWRQNINEYHVFISEVMLQQTQVARVLIKFSEFIKIFPSFQTLSNAPLREVLTVWKGLGYNRRAKYLQESAQIIINKYNGKLPPNEILIDELPGIGPATASSIFTFTYNKPSIFIETNIRRVYIHHFFKDRNEVGDRELVPFIEKTLDRKKPREWYYALMDYGAMLGKTIDNPNKRSKHYVVQSRFEGSNRKVRGEVIQILLEKGFLSQKEIEKCISYQVGDMRKILDQMVKEGMIGIKNEVYFIQ